MYYDEYTADMPTDIGFYWLLQTLGSKKFPISNIYVWLWFSNPCDKDLQWRQDIWHFNKRYSKHQSTEQETLHLVVIE